MKNDTPEREKEFDTWWAQYRNTWVDRYYQLGEEGSAREAAQQAWVTADILRHMVTKP